MTDAFLSAKLLAGCLTSDAADRCGVDDATSCYQQQRDAASANAHRLTLKTARLAPPSPRLESLYRAAADYPDVPKRIFDVLGGYAQSPISTNLTSPLPDRIGELRFAGQRVRPPAGHGQLKPGLAAVG